MSILARHGLLLPRILLLTCAVMVGAIAIEWALLRRNPPIPAVSATMPPPVAAQAPTIVLPPAASFSEITQRPLFSQARRPEPADRGRSGPPPARPSLALLGVVMTGNSHYALIRHGNPPKLEQLAEGQSIDGWQIQTIANDHVTLTSGSASADFVLGGGNRPGAAAAPTQPLSGSWGGPPDL
jgi:type II secretory pathway component PulC